MSAGVRPSLPQRDSTLPMVGSSVDHGESPSPALAAAPEVQQRQEPDDIENAQRPGSSYVPSGLVESAMGPPEATLMYTLKRNLHESHKADYDEAIKSFGPRRMSLAVATEQETRQII